jgi:hypothetical protein
LLILIDGEPALRQVEGQKLMRVVNTRALMLLDQSTSRYYLQAMGRWLSAALPTGPYTLATSVPAGIDPLKEQLAKAQTVDLLIPKDPAAAPKEMPTIYVSTTPAELIQSLGEPQYSPITGTQLLYCSNSDSALFMQVGTQQLYLLVSGRWFKAMTLQGPWTFVAGKDLPPDFAKIPPDAPKANVRVSVPGTPEAKEAVIANAVPQTATVKISEAKLTVSYDGAPKFKKIEETKGLSYAENTTLPVIRIDNDPQTFWCVQNGVWFSAPAPTGPWGVAVSIPGIIYTIPVGSPLHYVTYVKVYGSTSEVVYVGYTPGYMGTAVSTDGVVVYGTGYYYPAYVGTYWVGYPPTYGYGASFACGTATGFAFGFAAGAWMGSCWTTPYWGACYGYRDIDINTSNVYNNWRGGVTTANRSYKYDPWTGKSEGMGRASSFNPYTGRASVGGYSNYINRESGNYDLRKAGATYNPNTGVVTGGGVRRSGNMYDGEMDVTSGRFKYDTDTNTGVGRKGDDFYAGQDGNIYRYNKDEGWSQRTESGDWQSTDRPTGANSGNRQQQLSAQQRQNLESQRQSRQTSQQRYNTTRSSGSYQRTTPPSRSSSGGYRGGGGGMRGGGGRGGRR